MAEVKVENKSFERNLPATTRPMPLAHFGEYWPSFANPFALMRRLTEEMDRAFSTSWGLTKEMGAWCPAMDIKEHDGNLVVSADLPGLTKDDVKVECTGEGLVIHGERKREHEEKKAGWYRSERTYGEFYRTIPLPEGCLVDKANAQFKDGVLEVKVPLPPSAQHKAREIPIKG
jgi:HSP20 family protein